MLSHGDLVLSDDVLGKGAFGEVRKATYCGLPVAVKILHKHMHDDAAFREEVETLSKMHHPNIVSMLSYDSRVLVLDMYDSDAGTLTDLIDMVVVARDCMRALYYMHANGTCTRHGDIKPENILVKRDARGKIREAALGDMGLARACSVKRVYTGTPGYMPKIWNGINRMHDLFALAISLLDASRGEYVHCSFEEYEDVTEYPLPSNGPGSHDNTMYFAAALPERVRNPVSQMLALVYTTGHSGDEKQTVFLEILRQWTDMYDYIEETMRNKPQHPAPPRSATNNYTMSDFSDLTPEHISRNARQLTSGSHGAVPQTRLAQNPHGVVSVSVDRSHNSRRS